MRYLFLHSWLEIAYILGVYLNDLTADVDSFLAQFIQQFTNYRLFVMHTLIFVLTLTTDLMSQDISSAAAMCKHPATSLPLKNNYY